MTGVQTCALPISQSMLRSLCFHIMALIFSEQDDFLGILRLASLVLKAFLSFTF